MSLLPHSFSTYNEHFGIYFFKRKAIVTTVHCTTNIFILPGEDLKDGTLCTETGLTLFLLNWFKLMTSTFCRSLVRGYAPPSRTIWTRHCGNKRNHPKWPVFFISNKQLSQLPLSTNQWGKPNSFHTKLAMNQLPDIH